jgi:hypothetical protein
MAGEYASCPVEQPGVLTRTGSWRDRSLSRRVNTWLLRASNDAGSRKKLVTLISMSW